MTIATIRKAVTRGNIVLCFSQIQMFPFRCVQEPWHIISCYTRVHRWKEELDAFRTFFVLYFGSPMQLSWKKVITVILLQGNWNSYNNFHNEIYGNLQFDALVLFVPLCHLTAALHLVLRRASNQLTNRIQKPKCDMGLRISIVKASFFP